MLNLKLENTITSLLLIKSTFFRKAHELKIQETLAKGKDNNPFPIQAFVKPADSPHRMFANEIVELAYFPYI